MAWLPAFWIWMIGGEACGIEWRDVRRLPCELHTYQCGEWDGLVVETRANRAARAVSIDSKLVQAARIC